jgi:SAM-dependent methyltransferase
VTLVDRIWRRLSAGASAARSSGRALLERGSWRQAARDGKAPVDVFGNVDDAQWLWLNTRGYRREESLRALLPGVPSEEVQLHFTGSSGDITFREAWNVYRLVRDTYNRHSTRGPLSRSTPTLDYGCGWGRITRFFLKDVGPGSLTGIDINDDVLEICRQTNRWASFQHVDVLPPTTLPDAGFDLIYAYSVFSHLSEEAHDRWLDEFHRLLKPGGILIVTTRQREFIEKCAWLRTPEAVGAPSSHLVSAGAFLDGEEALQRYDAGEYCFSHRGEDDPPHFGETCIPRAYVARHWADRFTVRDYIDDGRYCEQNVIVVQKDPSP